MPPFSNEQEQGLVTNLILKICLMRDCCDGFGIPGGKSWRKAGWLGALEASWAHLKGQVLSPWDISIAQRSFFHCNTGEVWTTKNRTQVCDLNEERLVLAVGVGQAGAASHFHLYCRAFPILWELWETQQQCWEDAGRELLKPLLFLNLLYYFHTVLLFVPCPLFLCWGRMKN